MRKPPYIPNFDSASAMVAALARFLHGRDFPALGTGPSSRLLGRSVDALPRAVREQIYIWSGWIEAVPSRTLGDIRAEDISRWVVSLYPERRYPLVLVGSASGALVHLAAALGVPWLPQTFFIPVRHGGELHPDEGKRALEWGIEHARPLLEANPELQLHHMHDPNQDRLMIQRMAYFRVKRRRLGETYERFLEERLEPEGTIVLVDCRRTWPCTRVADRHVFQFGALGGATEDEFLHGGPRVEDYLTRYGSHRRRWDPPEADEEVPEAEWGFEPSLAEDLLATGRRVVRLAFDEPEHPSPLVADLYRAWHRERGLPANRLLVESFILLEPYWALRTGSVPFWMKFNMEPCSDWLEAYLDQSEPWDEILLMLFSHGVHSVGFPPIDRWRSLLERARERGKFVAVDERRHPLDIGVYSRYSRELQRAIAARHPLPEPIAFERVEEAAASGRYPLRVQAAR